MKLKTDISPASTRSNSRERGPSGKLGRSNLYAFFRRELDEINRHKWLESEKAGRDLGFEWALLDWVRNHRTDWRRTVRF